MIQSVHICFRCLTNWLVGICLVLGVQAQSEQSVNTMVTGTEMANFAEAFGLSATDWKVQQTACSVGANILTPGQSATFTFFVQPQLVAYKGKVKLEVIPYGTRWRRATPLCPVVYHQGEVISTNILEAELPVEGGLVNFTPVIGEKYGGYGLVMELEGRGRAFAGSVVRSLKRNIPIAAGEGMNYLSEGVFRASTEDRIASVTAVQRMLGLLGAFPVNPANVVTEQSGHLGGKEYTVTQAWAPAAALAVVQEYVGAMEYKGIVFEKGVPWVFIFEEAKTRGGNGTLVVVGDLSSICNPNGLPFRSVQLRAGASLSIENPKGEFMSTDFYGNGLESVGGKIIIPLNGSGYLLRTTGGRGSFKRLLGAVRQAEVRNVEPVELVVNDFGTSVTNENGVLSVQVANVLNRKVKGSLQVLVPGAVFRQDTEVMTLQPFQLKKVEFPLVGYLSQERDGNNYPLIVAWTDEGGVIKHAETLHINILPKFTPSVDGQLQDWKDCLPQPMPVQVQKWNPFELYQPFWDWPNGTLRNTLSVWVAWDESNFYFAGHLPPMVSELGRNIKSDSYSITYAVKGNISRKKSSESVFRLSWRTDGQAECQCLAKNSMPENRILEDATVVMRGLNWEVAVPWSQMPELYALVRRGKPIYFTYRAQVGEMAWELPNGRSASRENSILTNGLQWQNTIRFEVEGCK